MSKHSDVQKFSCPEDQKSEVQFSKIQISKVQMSSFLDYYLADIQISKTIFSFTRTHVTKTNDIVLFCNPWSLINENVLKINNLAPG